jgi:hypothetical protein
MAPLEVRDGLIGWENVGLDAGAAITIAIAQLTS